MTLTITIEGYGQLTAGEDSSYWGEEGDGSAPDDDIDNFLSGAQSISSKVSGSNKDGWLYYDIVSESKTALDFTPSTGAEEGQHIYIWVATSTYGKTEIKANTGMAIRLGSGTNPATNTMTYNIGGSDDANGWAGGWKCFVIDPTITGTESGTFDISDVTYIGFFMAMAAGIFAAANQYVDSIAVGTGVRIIGTDVDGWQDVVDYCTDHANRAWGMVQEREGIYYIYGNLQLGDSTQTGVTTLEDESRVFKFGNSAWWSGSAWVTTMASGLLGLTVEDASTYPTTYSETGTTFIGSDVIDTTFVLYGGSEATSISTMSGVTWNGIDGGFTWGDDSDHSATNCIWNACAEVDLVGAVAVTGCTFKNYAGELAALLWNSSIDITECLFQDNDLGTAGAAIRHTAGGTVTYYDLIFTSNDDDDVYLNHATASLTVNKDGTANPSTYHSSGSGTVTFVGTVNLKLTVKDPNGDAIVGARVLMESNTGGSDDYLESVNITSSGSVATVTHTGHSIGDGEMVNIRGANQPEYNGAGKVTTYISSTQYSYVITGTPDSPATGTITASQCYISELTIAGGIAEQSYASGATQPARFVVRHGTSPDHYDDVSQTVSDISGGVIIPVQMGVDE